MCLQTGELSTFIKHLHMYKVSFALPVLLRCGKINASHADAYVLCETDTHFHMDRILQSVWFIKSTFCDGSNHRTVWVHTKLRAFHVDCVWIRFKIPNNHFHTIEIFREGKMYEQTYSTPHPSLTKYCLVHGNYKGNTWVLSCTWVI